MYREEKERKCITERGLFYFAEIKQKTRVVLLWSTTSGKASVCVGQNAKGELERVDRLSVCTSSTSASTTPPDRAPPADGAASAVPWRAALPQDISQSQLEFQQGHIQETPKSESNINRDTPSADFEKHTATAA